VYITLLHLLQLIYKRVLQMINNKKEGNMFRRF